MIEEYYKNLLKRMEENIIQIQKIAIKSRTISEKMLWNNIINEEMYKRCVLQEFIDNMREVDKFKRQQGQSTDRVFTIDELSKYNGKNGSPAYIAVNGIVYDVTYNAAWAAGTHFGLSAGKDLTAEFKSCHGQQAILDKLPKVGVLQV